eukprot:3270499-Prymnesium_polylepis.2
MAIHVALSTRDDQTPMNRFRVIELVSSISSKKLVCKHMILFVQHDRYTQESRFRARQWVLCCLEAL